MEVAEKLQLDSNPLDWSVADVVRFLKSTDCAPLARIFLDQVSFLSAKMLHLSLGFLSCNEPREVASLNFITGF